MTKVAFLPVQTAKEKIEAILQAVLSHFERKEKVLILVPNPESERYLVDLLWKVPEERFIPHGSSPLDPVAIVQKEENVNQAAVLINLCPEAPFFRDQFTCIYEFIDHTHPEKLAQSRARQKTYGLTAT